MTNYCPEDCPDCRAIDHVIGVVAVCLGLILLAVIL